MNRMSLPALALAGALSLSLFGCQGGAPAASPPAPSLSEGSVPPETDASRSFGATSQEEPAQSAPADEAEAFSFAHLTGWDFSFQSGVGAWGTGVYIREDGSFAGTYSDSDMNLQYRCDFSGQFTQPVQVNDYTWSVEIARMEYVQPVGTEEDGPDGIHYIYSEPYGLDGAERILIYLPGAPISQLPEDYVSWVTSTILHLGGYSDISQAEALPFYGLYNEAQGQGFSSYDMVAGLEEYLASTQEQTAELEGQLAEDGSLSQGDINSVHSEIYSLWDSVLNRVWNVLMEMLPPEKTGPLIQEELDWIRRKEEQSAQAAQEYGGGSLSIMAQYQRAAELTRERVYELMEELP